VSAAAAPPQTTTPPHSTCARARFASYTSSSLLV
jgi:hypothetical protein